MRNIVSEIRIAVLATVSLAVIVCGVYPLAVWGVSQALFPSKANGSLIVRDGKVIGSELLSQNFSALKYFHPRPSSAGETGYDGSSSGGSNLGPISQKLIDAVKERTETYRTENDLPPSFPVPADAVTASPSGLDPHISVKNAMLQAKRVARARATSEEAVLSAINANTQARDLGILGEPRVNVLTLNLSLDAR
jgi:potassium-transporting ATPase KdpC subunit